MNVAKVTSWGSPPVYMPGTPLPAPSPAELQLKVVAVGVPPLVRGRAAKKHSTAVNASLPYDPSVDGVGLDETTGDQYYISPMAGQLFANRVNADRKKIIKLEHGSDAIAVAGLMNPVSSSWMALRCRFMGDLHGKTVVVLGATSRSGRAAVNTSRSLGAGKVVGVGRNEASLAGVQGIDEHIALQSPFVMPSSVGPVDVVLDYVGGKAAVDLLQAAEVGSTHGLQYIHIGDLAGEDEIKFPASMLNAKAVRITGSGIGSWSRADMQREISDMVQAVAKMPRPSDVMVAPLAEVASVWDSEDAQKKRLVLVP